MRGTEIAKCYYSEADPHLPSHTVRKGVTETAKI